MRVIVVKDHLKTSSEGGQRERLGAWLERGRDCVYEIKGLIGFLWMILNSI